jgi:hypothetical protein
MAVCGGMRDGRKDILEIDFIGFIFLFYTVVLAVFLSLII